MLWINRCRGIQLVDGETPQKSDKKLAIHSTEYLSRCGVTGDHPKQDLEMGRHATESTRNLSRCMNMQMEDETPKTTLEMTRHAISCCQQAV